MSNYQRKLENRKRRRRENHIYWESNCAICSNLFQHDRMTAAYCTQKCRNRARAFSPKMIESLLRKSMLTLRSFKRVTEEERNLTSSSVSLTEALDMLRATGASQNDINQIQENIRLKLAKDRLDEISRQRNLTMGDYEFNPNDHSQDLIDPEMVNFSKTMGSDNSGFGSTATDPEMEKLIYHIPDEELIELSIDTKEHDNGITDNPAVHSVAGMERNGEGDKKLGVKKYNIKKINSNGGH